MKKALAQAGTDSQSASSGGVTSLQACAGTGTLVGKLMKRHSRA